MKEIVSNKMLFYNESTGQREAVDLLRGESAYEGAVRQGLTTLSEEDWLKEYTVKRDAAITEIVAKGAETLATIPEDYAKLSSDVTALTEEVYDLYDRTIPVNHMDGKYVDTEGEVYNNSESCATDYVAINSGFTVKAENLYLTSSRSICTYDDNKKFVRLIANGTADTEVVFTVEDGEKYLRATGEAGVAPKLTLVNKPITSEIARLNKMAQTAIGLGESIVNRRIALPEPKVGYMVKSDGTVDVNEDSDAYEMVPIQRGYTIKVTNAFTLTGRSISAYDANGAFVKCLATNSDTDKLLAYSFVVDDYDFISVTTKTGENISVEYVDKWTGLSEEMLQAEMADDRIGNYEKTIIELDKSKFVTGYLNAYGTVTLNDSYRTTDFVEVESGRKIVIKNFMTVSYLYVCFYNRYKDIVSIAESETTASTIPSFEIEVPNGVKYVRYSMSFSHVNTTSIEYSGPLKKTFVKEFGLVRGWNESAFEKISNLFGKASSKPIITVIDDDTISSADVERFYNACNDMGIKGTYACLTRQFETDSALKDKLLDYQRKGFQIVCHGYTQGDFYQANALRNLADCEDDLIRCMQDLNAAGFVDFKFWVTPFGVFDADMQRLAKRLGHECLVMIGSEEIETTEAKHGRFALRRPGFTPDTNVNMLKTLIDECVEKNGWLLLGTHIYNWNDMTNFNEVVNYAKEKGCEFMTLGEAYREREAIYRFYEMF